MFVLLFFFFFVCFCFFFQAEDGIRDTELWLEFRRVLFRSAYKAKHAWHVFKSLIIIPKYYKYYNHMDFNIANFTSSQLWNFRPKVLNSIKMSVSVYDLNRLLWWLLNWHQSPNVLEGTKCSHKTANWRPKQQTGNRFMFSLIDVRPWPSILCKKNCSK